MRKKKDGFTLIEMVISLAIIAILSGIMIVYSGVGKKQVVLFTEQAKINGVLNRAKALALQKFKSGERAKNCALGVYFSGLRDYILFEDRRFLDGSCDGRYSGEEEKIEAFQLNPQVVLAQSPEVILFIPPYLIASSTDQLPVRIILRTNDGDEVSVEVGSGGEITSY